jgi:Putative peptidoglycan binding domain
MGLGMRESSGKHCEGRDQSASNTTSDTAEAGLFQQSWNSHTCSTEIDKLFDEYKVGLTSDPPQCALATFKEGVSCSSGSWSNYGSGTGRDFQQLAKSCPQFTCEVAGVGLRNLRQHWGPINRKDAELRPDADALFLGVQEILEPGAHRMNPLDLWKYIPLIVEYGGRIKEIVATATSNADMATKIKALGGPVGNLLADIARLMFPNVESQLQIAAAATTWDPTYTRRLQDTLNKYLTPSPNLDVDGAYGPATKAAVELAQAKLGIDVDGWAGKDTKKGLEQQGYIL